MTTLMTLDFKMEMRMMIEVRKSKDDVQMICKMSSKLKVQMDQL